MANRNENSLSSPVAGDERTRPRTRVTWRSGPRTRAWDELWRWLLADADADADADSNREAALQSRDEA